LNIALPPFARLRARGLEVRVRLTPKSSSDRVEGTCESADGPALAARVRAVPADGAANTALERLIADWLGLSKSSISLTAGLKSRVKVVTVRGPADVTIARLNDRLAELLATKTKT